MGLGAAGSDSTFARSTSRNRDSIFSSSGTPVSGARIQSSLASLMADLMMDRRLSAVRENGIVSLELLEISSSSKRVCLAFPSVLVTRKVSSSGFWLIGVFMTSMSRSAEDDDPDEFNGVRSIFFDISLCLNEIGGKQSQKIGMLTIFRYHVRLLATTVPAVGSQDLLA